MDEAVNKKIVIVGCGPGSSKYMTHAAIKAMESARVLVGAPHLLNLHAREHQETISIRADIAGALDAVAQRLDEGLVVILVSGDPGLWSLARPVIQRFGKDMCEVIPGISSVQLAFARLGVDWQDVRMLSAHKEIPQIALGDLIHARGIAILSGHQNAQSWIGDLAQALGEGYRMVVCEDLSLETERIQTVTPVKFLQMNLSTRTLVLLLKEEVF